MAVILSPAARQALQQIERVQSGRAEPSKISRSEGPGFDDVLKDALSKAKEAEVAAETKSQEFANGEAGIHETIIAHEKAGIAVRYAVTVKNKALEAYREIMNTQV